MDGLQHVLKCAIAVSDDENAHGPYAEQNFVTARLLVTSIQAKSLIGKQGSNIKYIQDSSKTSVRILGMHLNCFFLSNIYFLTLTNSLLFT